MQRQAQGGSILFRTIVLAGVVGLLISSAALPVPAQNSVPASAAQAARMPQFASRLAHPATPLTRPKSAASAPSDLRRHLPPAGVAYDNGPVNGQVDAWTINYGFQVTDSVQVNGGVTGVNFWAWLVPGDTISSVQVSVGSAPFGSEQFNGVVPLTQTNCFINGFGYNVCMESGSFTGGNGNAWVTLQNANVPSGDPVYWDENSGVGCESPGCPSQAQSNGVGTLPSEAFSMVGENGSPQCFQSGGNLQILSSLTQQQAGTFPGANGVTIDRAGNLYGTTGNGGDNSAGFAFKLTHSAEWLLDPLYSFLGGSGGSNLTGAILGPNGGLYGSAQGGIQNCGSDGSQYCGLVFNLRPQPTACLTALCSWTENAPYRFSSESDGSGFINVSASDQEGNLYGTTYTGGAHGAGTVFELTPSGVSWTKTTLYSFTGGSDGFSPTQVLVGNDGNLYGIASGSYGMIFQLTPSGGQWTESVIHAFNGDDGSQPGYLVQDSTGNLYGIVTTYTAGTMFVLQKNSGWAISEYFAQHSCQPEDFPNDNLSNLTIDSAGNLYGTGAGFEGIATTLGKKSPGGGECSYSYIFKARYDSSGWHYQDLDFLLDTIFAARGSLAIDSSGKLYGTTEPCGPNDGGTVWQFTP